MSAVHSRPSSRRGQAFAIEDLLLLRDWATAQSLWMCVHLDHNIKGEAYEEILAFTKMDSTLCQFIMWRDARAVILQPLVGRSRRFVSVVTALAIISPIQDTQVTDIQANFWPRNSRV